MKSNLLGLIYLFSFSCKPANLASNSAPTVSQDPIAQPAKGETKEPTIKVVGMATAWWKNCMSIMINGDESTRVNLGCNTQPEKIGAEYPLKGYNPNACNIIRVVLEVDSTQGDCGGVPCKDADKRIEGGKPTWTRSTGFDSDKQFFKVYSTRSPKWDEDKEFVTTPKIKSFLDDVKSAAANLEANESFFVIGGEDQPRSVIDKWNALAPDARTPELAKTLGLDWNDFIIGISGKGLSIENFSGGCQ